MNILSPEVLQQETLWLLLPTALVLGALHGLEPGHSKTVMAAFIVAIRGTARQALLLALSATLSHTALVWLVVAVGLAFSKTWLTPESEPYFQLVAAVLMIGIGVWMLVRRLHDHHGHEHAHQHDDAHQAAHTHSLKQQLQDQTVTNGQIILFGLTGGLIPCPAAITVLLLCLQTHRFGQGMALVLSFSVGLGLTLMASGLVAAYGLRYAVKHVPRLEAILKKAPYAASLITLALGVYMGVLAVRAFG